MADLIALRVMPVNLTNSLAVPRPPPPPPPPPSEHMKRSASRNLFGAPKRGEIDALVEREQKLHCDHILERYNIDIKALDEHDRIMAAAVALQKQHKQHQQQQQHSGNVGDNQRQHHHHHHHQLNKCNSIKNNNSNNKQQISSSAAATTSLSPLKIGGIVSSLYAEPSTLLSLAMEREQRSKPYARQRTIKDYSFPVRKTLMQRRQETTPPNVPRCLAASSGSSVNGANKSQAIKISSVTKNMTPTTSPSLSSALTSSSSPTSSSSSPQELSNKTDSTATTTPTTNNNNNKDNKSNRNNVVVAAEVSQTSQSSSSSSSLPTTTTTTATPPSTAKCNETS